MDFCSLLWYAFLTFVLIQAVRLALADADLKLLFWALFDKTGKFTLLVFGLFK